MADREKVINGLECCAVGCRSGCPYSDIDDCESMLCADALALLKAQEAVVMAGTELTEAELIEKIRKAPIVLKPNVDAAPVVHGRWINYPECLGYDGAYCDENIVCSNCKSVWNIIDNDADRFDYCPTCGARMDGEEHAS